MKNEGGSIELQRFFEGFLLFVLAVLGFELRALCSLGRHPTT
jgi:hypothetical protein